MPNLTVRNNNNNNNNRLIIIIIVVIKISMGNTEIWLAQIRLNRPRIRITEEPLYCTFH